VGTGAKRIGGHGVESATLSRSLLLELSQRVGVDSDIQADLGAAGRTVCLHCLSVAEHGIDLV